MRGFASFWVELWRDRRGISATELGLLAGLIGGGVAMGGDSLGGALGDAFGGAADTVAGTDGNTDGTSGGTDTADAGDTGAGDGTGGNTAGTRAGLDLRDTIRTTRLAGIEEFQELDRIRRLEGGLIPALQNRIVFFEPSVGDFTDEVVTSE